MPCLILSGWAQPVGALAMLEMDALTFDYSDYASPEESFLNLQRFRDIDHIIAWSLGGQLAVRAIAAGVLSPKHLTLIAAPYQFVSAGDILGMDPLTFAQFHQNYAQNPARTKARFHALVAKGDAKANAVLAQLTHHPNVENTARWLPWLDALATTSLIESDLVRVPPTPIVHGENDAIVPVNQAMWFAKRLPHAQLQRWPETGHAPHLHDAARLIAEITIYRAQQGISA